MFRKDLRKCKAFTFGWFHYKQEVKADANFSVAWQNVKGVSLHNEPLHTMEELFLSLLCHFTSPNTPGGLYENTSWTKAKGKEILATAHDKIQLLQTYWQITKHLYIYSLQQSKTAEPREGKESDFQSNHFLIFEYPVFNQNPQSIQWNKKVRPLSRKEWINGQHPWDSRDMGFNRQSWINCLKYVERVKTIDKDITETKTTMCE